MALKMKEGEFDSRNTEDLWKLGKEARCFAELPKRNGPANTLILAQGDLSDL